MGILAKKHQEHHLSGIAKLSIVGMVVSLSAAFINTIWAVYLYSFFHSEVYVGLFSAILTVVAFASYFLYIPLIEKSDKSKIYSFSLLLFVIFYFLFAINTNFYFLIILAIIMTSFVTLRITSYGLLVRDLSSQKELARNEGLVYTLANLSFVVGPLVAGYIAARFGIHWIFVLSSAFLLAGFFVFKSTKISGKQGKKRLDKKVFKNFIDFFKNRERAVGYMLGTGSSIWWMFIYLFIPLYIIRSGFDEFAIGIFLFAIAFPLIILELPFSKLAGKKGFRKIFLIGHLIVAIASAICFFLTGTYSLLILLVLASIGMAMLEPTTEAYFFDILKGKERYRFYGPYNTALDTGNLIGKLAGAITLIFLPFKFLFLVFGAFMFLLFLLSFKTKKIVESRRKR
ncbi:MAG: MFS transporter [Nanoarchaeota archaeon]|nr:MFS transporter [Nanoarchaeota archaeon]MBU1051935.1 MFS transporter [Nanoarchaeota archaeon]MBU1988049.1 MFS transporter [Nanoarchaeota archaeon]